MTRSLNKGRVFLFFQKKRHARAPAFMGPRPSARKRVSGGHLDKAHMPVKKDSKKTPRRKTRRAKKNPRDNINVLAMIEALEQHVLGEKEMTATQVSAALALLKKTLPDITEAKRRTALDSDKTCHEEALGQLE